MSGPDRNIKGDAGPGTFRRTETPGAHVCSRCGPLPEGTEVHPPDRPPFEPQRPFPAFAWHWGLEDLGEPDGPWRPCGPVEGR